MFHEDSRIKLQSLTASVRRDPNKPGVLSFKPATPVRNALRVWISEIRLVLPGNTPKPIMTLKDSTNSLQCTDLNSLGRITLAPEWDPVMFTLTSRWYFPGQLFATTDNRNTPIDLVEITFCDENSDPISFDHCVLRFLVEYMDHPNSNHTTDNSSLAQYGVNKVGIPAMSLPY